MSQRGAGKVAWQGEGWKGLQGAVGTLSMTGAEVRGGKYAGTVPSDDSMRGGRRSSGLPVSPSERWLAPLLMHLSQVSGVLLPMCRSSPWR